MILDKINNANLYKGLSENLDKALYVAQTQDFAAKEDGKYVVDGDNVFYMVARYKTKPLKQCKLEAHKKYIDIQLLPKGSEIIGYTNIESLKVQTPYSDDTDLVFYENTDKITDFVLTDNNFVVLFPEDAHMPYIQYKISEDVIKVVIKVKV